MIRRPPRSPLFPYPTLFRSALSMGAGVFEMLGINGGHASAIVGTFARGQKIGSATDKCTHDGAGMAAVDRSEKHTSELQSRSDLVCRLLPGKTKTHQNNMPR